MSSYPCVNEYIIGLSCGIPLKNLSLLWDWPFNLENNPGTNLISPFRVEIMFFYKPNSCGYIPSIYITSFVMISDVDVERLRKLLTLSEVDLQDNPLTTETEGKLKEIDVFTVLVGVSDPEGKDLHKVE